MEWQEYPRFLQTVKSLRCKVIYFHNLAFDGHFILDYALRNNIPISCLIDGKSKIFYNFDLTLGCDKVEFRDSLKKFPTSLQGLSVQLGIQGKNEKPDFDRYIPITYQPTLSEIQYCIQDSNIIATAISQEYDKGRMRLTASSESYNRLKKTIPRFNSLYPTINDYEDYHVRRSYKGGYCYLNPDMQDVEINDVFVYDVNSLYPYVMVTKPLPFGVGFHEEPKRSDQLYVVRFKSEFQLKDGFLPTLQIKKNALYIGRENEYLTESNGETEMWLTNIDYDLAHKHYDFWNEEGHTYITYNSHIGDLASVINDNNARKEKASQEGDGYTRLVAKLDNNMSYGAFGINPQRYGSEPILEDDKVRLKPIESFGVGRYVPYASFVTSYAREMTITAGQRNYDSFIYSDTDSLHLTKPAIGIDIHDEHLGMWKHEYPTLKKGDVSANPPINWDHKCFPSAKYLRQKTYVHADENRNIFAKYNKYGEYITELKCAGLPDIAKQAITWDDFYIGKVIEGKLSRHVVKGGVCLLPTTFTIGG